MTSTDILRAINSDVWKPFRAAYSGLDVDAFAALHTPDLIRAVGPPRVVQSFDEMIAQMREFLSDMRSNGSSIAIDFRFLERLASDSLASERGIFRIELTGPDGARTVVGKFHVFLRRTPDGWRIAVDYDSNEGGTIDQASFDAATPMDDVDAFAT